MTTTQHMTPGHLLSNIPGALGFYPTESVVFMGFEATEHGSSTSLQLGPTMRINIDDMPEVMEEVAQTLRAIDLDVILAFVISQRPEPLLAGVAESLFEADQSHGLDIDSCWLASEIHTGASYEMMFGPDYRTLRSDGAAWMEGTIPEITASVTLQDHWRTGTLPEISRAVAVDSFSSRNSRLATAELDAMTRVAMDCGARLRAGKPLAYGLSTYRAEDVPEDIAAVLDEVIDVNECLGNPELLQVSAVWMSCSFLRDIAILEFLDNPEPAAELLLATARSFDGLIRANALALYAAVLISIGQHSRAGLVLTEAVRECSGHRLAELLLQAHRRGIVEDMIETLRDSSAQTRQRWLTPFEKQAG